MGEIKDLVKDTTKDIQDVVQERVFSPMYFYFILSWIIYNWTFLYSLLFTESDEIDGLKINFLLSFYPTNTWQQIASNTWYVFIGPAISTIVILWLGTILSEISYEKFETYLSNKRVIKRKVEYAARVTFAQEERKIRDAESDKNAMRYNDYVDYNEWLDEREGTVEVVGTSLNASEVLYNTDYQLYEAAYSEYEDYKKQAKDEEKNEEEDTD